jgi:hypothetical protein
MHRKCVLRGLLVLLAVGTANAFIPGPDVIRQCPKCPSPLRERTMVSGNTFGARFWTDGKMDAPMLPDRPWLVKCPKCSHIFWIDEAKELEKQTPSDDAKKWPNAAEPGLPTEADYLSVISAGKLSKNKELYARRRAWWAANDAFRMDSNAKVVFSPAQKKNLQSLAALLDEKDPEQRLAKAEILRELSRFDECLTLLAQPFESKDLTPAATFIRTLAKKRSSGVQEIKESEVVNNAQSQPAP